MLVTSFITSSLHTLLVCSKSPPVILDWRSRSHSTTHHVLCSLPGLLQAPHSSRLLTVFTNAGTEDYWRRLLLLLLLPPLASRTLLSRSHTAGVVGLLSSAMACFQPLEAFFTPLSWCRLYEAELARGPPSSLPPAPSCSLQRMYEKLIVWLLAVAGSCLDFTALPPLP